jgi:hypothetical protein
MQILLNTCRITLFCVVVGLTNPPHTVAQVQTPTDLSETPKKKAEKLDKIDFLFKVSPAVLSAATSVDMYTTVHGLDHPTAAYREDGTFLT